MLTGTRIQTRTCPAEQWPTPQVVLDSLKLYQIFVSTPVLPSHILKNSSKTARSNILKGRTRRALTESALQLFKFDWRNDTSAVAEMIFWFFGIVLSLEKGFGSVEYGWIFFLLTLMGFSRRWVLSGRRMRKFGNSNWSLTFFTCC